MKNEFVTYKQALALKELGFDEPCIGWYNPQVNYKKVTTDRYWAFHLTGEWENFKPSPLYQQAFRWFREKHLTYGIIMPTNVSEIQGIDCILEIHPPPDKHGIVYILEDAKLYTSYEEAESACLDKLIEICKNK